MQQDRKLSVQCCAFCAVRVLEIQHIELVIYTEEEKSKVGKLTRSYFVFGFVDFCLMHASNQQQTMHVFN